MILRNTVYKNTIDSSRFRVLIVFPESKELILLSLDRKDTLPYSQDLVEFTESVENDVYKEVEDPHKYINMEFISDKQREGLAKAWDMIGAFVQTEPECFNKKAISKFIGETTVKYGCTRKQVQRYLYKYWAGGMSKAALVPDYASHGSKGIARTNKKLGRPNVRPTNNRGMPIGEKEKAQIRTIINETYNKSEKYTKKTAYKLFISKYYTDSNGQLFDRYPTEAQFLYHAKKYIDNEKHFGKKKFARTMRGITGSSTEQANGPGAQYQIDATIADYVLVSSIDILNDVGRPTIYLISDTFSHMITGFYVGFKAPSWESAMMALAYAFTDKVELCARFGITISEEEWPCKGIPHRILTDNGELVSKSSNSLCSELHITLQNTSSWRPDMKGIIEQCFHRFNTTTKELLPGAVQADAGERGSHDYRKDACLTITDFIQILIYKILSENSKYRSEPIQESPDVICDNVPQIPLELWKWGEKNRTGLLKAKEYENIILALLPSETAVVTERGIRFKSIYFTCEAAINKGWFSKARQCGNWKVPIKFDPRDSAHILLQNIDGTFEWCSRTSAKRLAYDGCTFDEIDLYVNELKDAQSLGIDRNAQIDIDFMSKMDTIKQNAIDRKQVISMNSLQRTVNVKNIRDNRKEKLSRMQNSEALSSPQKEPLTSPDNTLSDDDFYADFASQIQKEVSNIEYDNK